MSCQNAWEEDHNIESYLVGKPFTFELYFWGENKRGKKKKIQKIQKIQFKRLTVIRPINSPKKNSLWVQYGGRIWKMAVIIDRRYFMICNILN